MPDVTSQGILAAIARKSVAVAAVVTLHESDTGTSGSTVSVNSASVTLPTNITSDDLLVMVFADNSTGTVTTPTGWTFDSSQAGSTNVTSHVFYREADGTEGSSVTVSKSNYSPWSATVVRLTGYNTTNIFDATTTTNGGASSTNNLPAITTSTDNSLVLRFGTWFNSDTDPTEEAGWSETGHSTSGTPATIATYKTVASAGSVAAYDYNVGSYMQFAHFSLAIKPA
jgi:hypothetical protein